MGFFDNVYSGTKKAADTVGKFAGETVEYSKLKFTIAGLKDKLEGKYKILGMMCYQSAKAESELDETAKLTISEIELLLSQINEKSAQLEKIRNTSKCQSCGANNPRSADYCAKCGSKLD